MIVSDVLIEILAERFALIGYKVSRTAKLDVPEIVLRGSTRSMYMCCFDGYVEISFGCAALDLTTKIIDLSDPNSLATIDECVGTISSPAISPTTDDFTEADYTLLQSALASTHMHRLSTPSVLRVISSVGELLHTSGF